MLKLVSTANTMESGKADSLSKMAIFCSLPSSLSLKLSFSSLPIGAPCSSVTVTNTLTSFTSTFSVEDGSCAAAQACRHH